MRKKTAFLLFALSFVGGFMLREMLIGVSSHSDSATAVSAAKEVNIESIIADTEGRPELVKLITPRKAVRGHYFEMLAYIQGLWSHSDLIVLLDDERNGSRIAIGRYDIVSVREALKNKITKVGPLNIVVPEGTPLGNYVIELGLAKKQEGDERYFPMQNTDTKTTIEIVGSYLDSR